MLDKFGMLGMKKVAEEKFKISLQELVENEDAVILSRKQQMFFDTIPTIYASTPAVDRGLRGAVVEHFVYSWQKYWVINQFKAVLEENSNLVFDIFTKCPPNLFHCERRRQLNRHVRMVESDGMIHT